jgi:hypothetical protein
MFVFKSSIALDLLNLRLVNHGFEMITVSPRYADLDRFVKRAFYME